MRVARARARAVLGVVSALGGVAAGSSALAAGTGEGAVARAEPGAVESVVVFPDRARVTRAEKTRCERGTARATFTGLPAALDVRTLRGEVREAAEVIGLSGDLVNEEQAVDPGPGR